MNNEKLKKMLHAAESTVQMPSAKWSQSTRDKMVLSASRLYPAVSATIMRPKSQI